LVGVGVVEPVEGSGEVELVVEYRAHRGEVVVLPGGEVGVYHRPRVVGHRGVLSLSGLLLCDRFAVRSGHARQDLTLVRACATGRVPARDPLRSGMRRLNRQPDDPVSEVLRGVRVHSSVYCVSELGAPWGFHVEDSSVAKFHLVLDGSCVLALDSGEQIEVGCGDLVLLPTGAGHAVRDRPGSRGRELERILAEHLLDAGSRLEYGGRGPRTRLVCGGFQLAEALPEGLLALLPTILHLDAGTGGLNRRLPPLFGLLQTEAAGD